ncbi:non-hydrolyzing UDP-N-acetylglucosamine 2-epimerase [Dyadobacter pollutisoli]|uniref:UDP-N-acetylglucosamine 2-epimerase (Non-hydrolyzing) n=1 Tax=Dyadobacter pollutisoli TaxID=2910158 RepID=A0A9E8N613_9BACT|nr:UDP-N-acetylglucosamine 2-epimerase (non-hydrolyzing) [Dyadobacter pollutisoli]WAC09968.1 UDP-N-acetylglucosamine 2-epimerase (non-hydrolyzing) [Dyadobacter pollutisoli]
MKVLNIVGARPNFVKIAPLHRAFSQYPDMISKIVHTGQHYDSVMSGIFFDQLDLPKPDFFLGVAAGTQTQQTAQIMVEFEKVLISERPDLVLVVGDVNSTLACTLVSVKMNVPLAHVEAGLRSGDRSMPEEINRILTDAVSDHLFVTEQAAVDNLLRENVADNEIHFTGNVMIDSLEYYKDAIDRSPILKNLGVNAASYVLMTMHRPANVDGKAGLQRILKIVKRLALLKTVVFPIHPRTWKNIEINGLKNEFENVQNLKILEPQGYLEFLNLTKNAALVVTDSGGIQEETTYLNVPCITLRENTERPVTFEVGTNFLLKNADAESVSLLATEIFAGNCKKGTIPAGWDGKAAERIVAILREKYINSYVCDK